MTMTRYEIEEELDKLYKELETVKNADEETVCRAFNADSKQEYINLIQEEIDGYEAALDEIYRYEHREVNYRQTADNPYLVW